MGDMVCVPGATGTERDAHGEVLQPTGSPDGHRSTLQRDTPVESESPHSLHPGE